MNYKNNQPGGNLPDDALERPLALDRNLIERVYALAQQLSELGVARKYSVHTEIIDFFN